MLPAVMRVIDGLLCTLDLFQPDGWADQLECVDHKCYVEEATAQQPVPFAVIDPLVTFTSGPDLWNLIMKVTTKVINAVTGQNYDGTAAGATQLPDLGALYYDISPQVQACNACFKCQVPEFRFVWLMISLTFGCVFDAQKMAGQMEHHCLADGSYYTDVLCGPRGHFFATPADFAAATTGYAALEPWHAEGSRARCSTSRSSSAARRRARTPRTSPTWPGAGLSASTSTSRTRSARRPLCTRSPRAARQKPGRGPGRRLCLFAPGGHGGVLGVVCGVQDVQAGGRAPDVQAAVSEHAHFRRLRAQHLRQGPGQLHPRAPGLPGPVRRLEVGPALAQDVTTLMSKEEFDGLPAATLEAGRIDGRRRVALLEVPLFDTSPAFQMYMTRLRVRAALPPSIRGTAPTTPPRAPW